MKRLLSVALLAALALPGTSLSGQNIPFTSDTFLGLPPNIHLGEVAGVATNSRGEIFVYTRTGNPTVTIGTARTVSHGGSRLFQFSSNGTYMRELGIGAYGLLFAQQVRVDPQDNIWIVDRLANQVISFDPNGRVRMVFGRKPEAMTIPTAPPPEPGTPPAPGRGNGSGTAGESFSRPTDVAWDSQGNIYVSDGYGNARIAKYTPEGRWIMNWGQRGAEQGQFDTPHGIAIDAEDNVYVADRGNERIQVFDTEGTFLRQITGVGAPSAICISPPPNQRLFVSNSNPTDNIDVAGEIYVLSLDGRILGQFGRAGKMLGEFGTVNAIDCRNADELLVGEVGNWRVQRVRLDL
jgi:DNA-binding beta-propeller fold protein YncE